MSYLSLKVAFFGSGWRQMLATYLSVSAVCFLILSVVAWRDFLKI